MKKWFIFVGGILTGIVLMILVAFAYSASKSDRNNGLTWFEKPGDIIEINSFKIFQVLYDDAALVHGKSHENYDIFSGAVYLLTNESGKYYYDDEIVEVPDGKVVRQVGIYRYQTNSLGEKTVPIIKIMDE